VFGIAKIKRGKMYEQRSGSAWFQAHAINRMSVWGSMSHPHEFASALYLLFLVPVVDTHATNTLTLDDFCPSYATAMDHGAEEGQDQVHGET